MRWTAISGSWRKMNKELEGDVRGVVREVMSRGDGVVSGGALNVDYIALDTALRLNPTADRIKIFIPATFEIFSAHYRRRAKEGIITEKQAEKLLSQLTKLKQTNPSALIENKDNKIIDKAAYFQRNSAMIELADELIAFWVNQSLGTKDAIDKAWQKGIPVKVFEYTIE